MSKIKITSAVPYTISFYLPELKVNHLFKQNSPVYFIEEETLKEAMFYPVVKKLFDDGALVIEDKKDAIKVGLASEDPEENKIIAPRKYIEADLIKLLAETPYEEFEKEIQDYPKVQLNRLVNLAVANHLTDYNKVKLLKEKTGRDINKIIELKDSDK